MKYTGEHLKLGLGGDLERSKYKYEEDFLMSLISDVNSHYPNVKIDFLEGYPPNNVSDTKLANKLGIPWKQFTSLYVIGGNTERPDALTALEQRLEQAQASETVDRINMQVMGNNHEPDIDTLISFYKRVHRLEETYSIEVYTETHVDRFTYDPRRLIEVNEALIKSTNNKVQLKIAADFSHYVHQIDNPNLPQYKDINSGKLNIDPFDNNNYLYKNIVDTGMIGYGHLRMAIPNTLERGKGMIQYPVINPNNENGKDAPYSLKYYGDWSSIHLESWTAYYKYIFKHIITHPEEGEVRFSTEFIDTDGEYRMDNYSNRFQNIAMLAYANKIKKEVLKGLNEQKIIKESYND